MIYAVTGKPGAGKSYLLVCLCQKFLESGRDVFSNVKIDISKMKLKRKFSFWRWLKKLFTGKGEIYQPLGECYYWQELKHFRNVSKGVILLDEAGSYFESRSFQNMAREDIIKFQQHRKDGLDIYLTVQNFDRIDVTIRQLTNICVEVHNIFGKIFISREYYPEDINLKKRKSFATKIFFFSKYVANLYDTFQKINTDDYRRFVDSKFIRMDSLFDKNKPTTP